MNYKSSTDCEGFFELLTRWAQFLRTYGVTYCHSYWIFRSSGSAHAPLKWPDFGLVNSNLPRMWVTFAEISQDTAGCFVARSHLKLEGNTDGRTSENFGAYILYWVGSKSIIPLYLDIFGRMNIRFPPRVNQGTRVLTHSHPRMFSPGSDFQGQTPPGAWQAWHEHCGSWNVLKSKLSDNHNYPLVN